MHRDPKTNTVLHSTFRLGGTEFCLMEGQSSQNQYITPAISFMVYCRTQDEIDFYWNKLSAGGRPGQCGWLEDKFGVSWQVVPAELADLMTNPSQSEKAMSAILKMTKIDLQELRQAALHFTRR